MWYLMKNITMTHIEALTISIYIAIWTQLDTYTGPYQALHLNTMTISTRYT